MSPCKFPELLLLLRPVTLRPCSCYCLWPFLRFESVIIKSKKTQCLQIESNGSFGIALAMKFLQFLRPLCSTISAHNQYYLGNVLQILVLSGRFAYQKHTMFSSGPLPIVQAFPFLLSWPDLAQQQHNLA